MSSDCVFCAIVAGVAPASIVYSDDWTTAFLDVAPITPGHLLVVSKRHAATLSELDPETGGHLFRTGQRLAAGLRMSSVRADGVNFFLADGAPAGQEVFHVHLHVLPRWKGDGFKLSFRSGSPSRAELDASALEIRKGLERLTLA